MSRARDEIRRAILLARGLRFVAPALRVLGIAVDRKHLDAAIETGTTLLDVTDSFNTTFLRLGWVAHEGLNVPAATAALAAARAGDLPRAEEILVAAHGPDAVETALFTLAFQPWFERRAPLARLAAEDSRSCF